MGLESSVRPYDENGPSVWAELSPDYALCAEGSRQSPIDLALPDLGEPSVVLGHDPSGKLAAGLGPALEVAELDGEMSYQTIRSARKNPVLSLKYD